MHKSQSQLAKEIIINYTVVLNVQTKDVYQPQPRSPNVMSPTFITNPIPSHYAMFICTSSDDVNILTQFLSPNKELLRSVASRPSFALDKHDIQYRDLVIKVLS